MSNIIKTYNGFPERDVDVDALFALVPDETVLAVAGQDLELYDAQQCLVGTTVREHLAALSGKPAVPYVDVFDSEMVDKAAELFGGDVDDWHAVFIRVQFADDLPAIENAWTNRVLQAAENVDKPKVVLQRDVYDTLELSSYAFGGIGAGTYNEGDDDVTDYVGEDGELLDGSYESIGVEIIATPPRLLAPVCAVGHAAFSAIPRRFDWYALINGATITENDEAVLRINGRKGADDLEARVTFHEWARELNVVRGR